MIFSTGPNTPDEDRETLRYMAATPTTASWLPWGHHRPTNASARGAGGLHAVRRCGLIDHLWGSGGQLVAIDHFGHELLMQLRNAVG